MWAVKQEQSTHINKVTLINIHLMKAGGTRTETLGNNKDKKQ